MPDELKDSRLILQELYQAVLGVPYSPDERGLVGDVQDVRKLLMSQNDRLRIAEQRISKIWGILIAVGSLGGAGSIIAIINFLKIMS